MTSTRKNPPVYRLARQPRTSNVALLIASQEQIRGTAPSSAAYSKVQPQLQAWNASTDAYSALYNQVQVAIQHLSDLRSQLHDAGVAFAADGRTYRNAVQLAAAGQPSIMTSLGFQAVIAGVAPQPALAAPTSLVGSPGVDPGAVHLRWSAPKGSHAYALQQSPDPVTATSWLSLPGQTRRTAKVGDLSPGAKYWFRVALVGAGGQSAWSAPIVVTARLGPRGTRPAPLGALDEAPGRPSKRGGPGARIIDAGRLADPRAPG